MINNILSIHLQISLGIILLYSAYKILLSKERNFKLNRIILITGLFIPFIIPFINMGEFNRPLEPAYTYMLDTVVVSAETSASQSLTGTEFTLWNILSMIYFTGLFFAFITRFIPVLKVIKLINNSKTYYINNIEVQVTDDNHGPFSFMGRIFISKGNIDRCNESILLHEKAHVDQLHFIDLFIIELALLFQWFNPFIYLYKRSILTNHEYLADEQVIKNGVDKLKYQNLMLNFAFNLEFDFMSNHFRRSLIKKRIQMMTKTKKTSVLKYMLLIPILAATVFIISCAENKGDKEVKKETTVVEEKPHFPGGQNALISFISSNVDYPEEARKQEISGQVMVSFIVDKEGKVKNVKVIEGVHELLDAEALRVVQSMPDWEPAKANGEPIEISLTIPITFKLQ